MQDDSHSEPCGCDDHRAADTRAGRRLEYFSLSWNVIEAGVSVAAGLAADSIALIGFGGGPTAQVTDGNRKHYPSSPSSVSSLAL